MMIDETLDGLVWRQGTPKSIGLGHHFRNDLTALKTIHSPFSDASRWSQMNIVSHPRWLWLTVSELENHHAINR